MTTEQSKEIAVSLSGINKWYGANHANRDINLYVEKGAIHGIIGENGAGKSTLMNILYGYISADSGTIKINGKEVNITSPNEAIHAGIGMVFQHFMLVSPFTVLENILLGVEEGFTLKKGKEKARKVLEKIEQDYQLEVNLDDKIENLPVGLQQRVEILKALYKGADVLILDEPTGVLTPQEADHLFKILKVLRDEGKTIILITHKLREIMDVTNRVSVMRRGTIVDHRETCNTNKQELAELMVGRKVLLKVKKTKAKPGKTLLDVKNISVKNEFGTNKVDNVSFSVREGEIVGIAGVSGNGQTELLEALSGMTKLDSGHIIINGKDVPKNSTALDIRNMGVAHVPEDRLKMGLIGDLETYENFILGYHTEKNYYKKSYLINKGKIVNSCKENMDIYDVRPSNPLLQSKAFSGGNQQKIVISREVEHEPSVMLIGQPTRGVDIGAIEFIHKRLIDMRNQGKALILVSVELDEIMSLSDRILVMYSGHIIGELAGDQATEQNIGLMMAGIHPEDLNEENKIKEIA